jgi:hypothetical protein
MAMHRASYVWRFFIVVPPVHRLLHVAMVVTTGVGAIVLLVDGRRAAVSMIPLLLLQLFAASSSFLTVARRGYYDLVFTSGERRVIVAAVHWAMSVLPGLLGWCALACLEVVVTGDGALLAPGTMAALFIVSSIPWAVGVAWPRFAVAIGWLLALSGWWILRPVAPVTFASSTAAGSVASLVEPLLYPPLLIGDDMTGRLALPGAASVLVAAAAWVCACVWIDRTDVALEAR